MKKSFRIIILLVIAVSVVLIGVHIWHTRYVWDYFAVVGAYGTFERMIDRHGEPNDIILPEYPRRSAIIKFNDFEVVRLYSPEWSGTSPFGTIQAMTVTGYSFRFGRYQIGVGSTREEIKWAYRRFEPTES